MAKTLWKKNKLGKKTFNPTNFVGQKKFGLNGSNYGSFKPTNFVWQKKFGQKKFGPNGSNYGFVNMSWEHPLYMLFILGT